MRTMHDCICAETLSITASLTFIAFLVLFPVMEYATANRTNENKSLRKRLSKYEKPNKNSSNSSTPPSKENMSDELVRRTNSLRKPTGMNPGGQPGHEGHAKKWFANPNVTEERMSIMGQ